jgi:hypothetical protein
MASERAISGARITAKNPVSISLSPGTRGMAGLTKIVHGSERAKTILVEDAGPHSPAYAR